MEQHFFGISDQEIPFHSISLPEFFAIFGWIRVVHILEI